MMKYEACARNIKPVILRIEPLNSVSQLASISELGYAATSVFRIQPSVVIELQKIVNMTANFKVLLSSVIILKIGIKR